MKKSEKRDTKGGGGAVMISKQLLDHLYPFVIYLKPEKGTPFARNLPV